MDRIKIDVFALGAVGYYLLTRRPPAADGNALRERLQRDKGLDLAADLPQVLSSLRTLVLDATRPPSVTGLRPSARSSTSWPRSSARSRSPTRPRSSTR
jgi:hypothetical protein